MRDVGVHHDSEQPTFAQVHRALDHLSEELRKKETLRHFQNIRLGEEMAHWCLTTTAILDQAAVDSLEKLRSFPSEKRIVVGTILASTSFTAAFQAIAIPLLLGHRLIVRTPSNSVGIPDVAARFLERDHPLVAQRMQLRTFHREDLDARQAFFSEVDALAVYGSDHTIKTLQELFDGVVFGFGHGLGVALVAEGDDVANVAPKIALDVAAYDQTGCLSPHFVLFGGHHSEAIAFGERLERELSKLGTGLPRYPLSPKANGLQLQWRSVATIRGTLFEGKSCSVSLEKRPPRLSCGFRNISIVCSADFKRDLEPFRHHIKRVASTDKVLADWLPHATHCAFGEMQTPRFGEHEDGLRFAEALQRSLAPVSK